MPERQVSVVIPSHNRLPLLHECLDALERQTILPGCFEVVVIDDGSLPPYPDDLGRFRSAFPVRVLHQPPSGPAAARNRGVREARAELVALLDDDCRPEPAWLETLLTEFQQHPAALLGGTVYNGLSDDLQAQASHLILDIVYDYFNAPTSPAGFLASNNILCRRDDYLCLGGFDESFRVAGGEDRDFCDRWLSAGKPLVWVRQARVEHRHHQNLRKFLGVHWRYGRGAFQYQRRRSQRHRGTTTDDLGFYGTLLRQLPSRLGQHPGLGRQLRLLGLLGCWQLANLGGYAMESLQQRARDKNRPG